MKQILILFSLMFSLGANDLYEILNHDKKELSIVLFYTKWCPACQESVAILNEIHEKFQDKIKIIAIEIQSQSTSNYLVNTPLLFPSITLSREEATRYGLQESVPLIYIFDKELKLIKKQNETPEKEYFIKLVTRLKEGFLANGTLPIEQRIDLWKEERK